VASCSVAARAAVSPRGTISAAASNAEVLTPSSSGRMSTSTLGSSFSSSRLLSRLSTWPSTCAIDSSSSRVCNPSPTSTAMMTSAPISSAASTGRLATRPPSTSSRPSSSWAAIRPGTAMLARMARPRSPSRRITTSPVSMSVATARNGIGSSSKLAMPTVCRVSVCSAKPRFWPWTRAGGR